MKMSMERGKRMELNFSRLVAAAREEIAAVDKQISDIEKDKAEYESLQQRLQTLPDAIRYDSMVPLGSRAFVPGRLVHTNEVTVLLGAGWFVECSAKQACAICARRIGVLSSRIDELKAHRKLLADREKMAQEMGVAGGSEIMEPLDEAHERDWLTRHKQSVRKEREQQSEAAKRKAPGVDLDAIFRKYELEENEEDPLDFGAAKSNPQTQLGEPIKPQQTAQESERVIQGIGDLQVVERDPSAAAATTVTSSSEFDATRPVSRFKAARAKK